MKKILRTLKKINSPNAKIPQNIRRIQRMVTIYSQRDTVHLIRPQDFF